MPDSSGGVGMLPRCLVGLLCDKELNHRGGDGRLMDKWICGATRIVSESYPGDPAPRMGSFMQESVCFWKLKG